MKNKRRKNSKRKNKRTREQTKRRKREKDRKRGRMGEKTQKQKPQRKQHSKYGKGNDSPAKPMLQLRQYNIFPWKTGARGRERLRRAERSGGARRRPLSRSPCAGPRGPEGEGKTRRDRLWAGGRRRSAIPSFPALSLLFPRGRDTRENGVSAAISPRVFHA